MGWSKQPSVKSIFEMFVRVNNFGSTGMSVVNSYHFAEYFSD